jgi:hypothetical protein
MSEFSPAMPQLGVRVREKNPAVAAVRPISGAVPGGVLSSPQNMTSLFGG